MFICLIYLIFFINAISLTILKLYIIVYVASLVMPQSLISEFLFFFQIFCLITLLLGPAPAAHKPQHFLGTIAAFRLHLRARCSPTSASTNIQSKHNAKKQVKIAKHPGLDKSKSLRIVYQKLFEMVEKTSANFQSRT